MRGWILAAFMLCAAPAQAWWALWVEPDPPPIPRQTPSRLAELREAECGEGGAVTTRFGQTRFMRGTADKSALSQESWSRLAGLSVATGAEQAEAIAASLLEDSEAIVRIAARTALARWYLAHDSVFGEQALTRAGELLANRELATVTDAQAMRAGLAMRRGDWSEAAREAEAALESEPLYYDAQVIAALAGLHALESERRSCSQALVAMEEILLPVLQSGACPTHVAHFELAAKRYLDRATSTAVQRNALLREMLLAYVARNDQACADAGAKLLFGPGGSECALIRTRYACAAGGRS